MTGGDLSQLFRHCLHGIYRQLFRQGSEQQVKRFKKDAAQGEGVCMRDEGKDGNGSASIGSILPISHTEMLCIVVTARPSR